MLPKSPSKYLLSVQGDGLKDDINGIHIIAKLDIGEYAHVTGTIAQVPMRDFGLNLEVGDEIAFHYHVTSTEKVDSKDGEEVFSAAEPEIFQGKVIRRWTNKLGQGINSVYVNNDKWACWMTDNNVIVDHKDNLDERSMNSWLERHKFEETYTMKRTNNITLQGEEYFLCRPDQVYAVKRGEEIKMMPGYMLCELLAPTPEITTEGGIIKISKEQTGPVWLNVLHSNTNFKQVYVKRHECAEYTFWGKKYLMVVEKRIIHAKDYYEGSAEGAKIFAI